jgi:hypothetical protein
MALLTCRLRERRASLGVLPSARFLVVAGAAIAVPAADLGDRGHVDGVVEPPAPAPAQPADLARAGGDLDRRGPVVGGEGVPAAEAGHIADVADDRSGDDRPDSEQPGQAGPGRGGGGELTAGGRDRLRRCDRSEDLCGLACGDRLGDAAGNQLAQHGVQPADDLGAGAAQVPAALDQIFSTAA